MSFGLFFIPAKPAGIFLSGIRQKKAGQGARLEVDDQLIVAFKTVTEQQRQIGTWTRREIVPDGSVGASLRQTVHLSAQPLPLSSCCVAVKESVLMKGSGLSAV
ncbi:hypothetical protein [Kalamiella sp. sgz302252]|uniref:hypothetical protein n=1 Tax=Pantoea sp. sgz302252 TaxID=3341827 RepID=UPI0036D2492B